MADVSLTLMLVLAQQQGFKVAGRYWRWKLKLVSTSSNLAYLPTRSVKVLSATLTRALAQSTNLIGLAGAVACGQRLSRYRLK